jgi:chemotaxis protein MotB
MAALSSRRRGGAADYTWPGYVDALTTLLMVLIFLLTLFSVGQFTLSTALTSRDSAIDRLGKQVGDLASQLSIEKKATQSLQKDLEQLTLQLRQERSERERLGADLAAERKSSDALKVERDQLTERLTSMIGERKARGGAAGPGQGVRGQGCRPAEGDRAPAPGTHPARRLARRR